MRYWSHGKGRGFGRVLSCRDQQGVHSISTSFRTWLFINRLWRSCGIGPLRVKKFGTGLEFNKHAWNKEANLLFLESPVGVGFSYTNTSSDLTAVDDRVVAKDAYSFLINWLRRFPQYQDHDFYISGESYGGHYVPQLAELVYERNKDRQKYQYINLKGFIVGNPETNDYYDYKGLAEYAWSHAVVSDQVYELINKVCDFRADNWSKACMDAMGIVMKQYHLIDFYNIYAPKCNLAQTTTTSPAADDTTEAKSKGRLKGRIRMYSGYDPCFFAYAEDYFNKIDVQRSLHANVSGKIRGKWTVCNDSIFYNTYKYTVFSVLPIYSKLIKGGLRIWVYSGDADGRVPVIGTRYCMDALGLPVKTHWQPWYHNKQVAGRFVEYEGLTMVTVRGAGHLVPSTSLRRLLCSSTPSSWESPPHAQILYVHILNVATCVPPSTYSTHPMHRIRYTQRKKYYCNDPRFAAGDRNIKS
uniref:Carboxypeptidase n=1 Tax=Ananas comosus var. bracteatus TaxID=296719 RepID=A0A6V7PGT7_ANACO|nr:unnamed protein product [Ananas comosus var. bracteatus]